MESTKKAVIVWAVDPFSGEWRAQKNAAKAIASLTSKRSFLVQPVYVAANPLPNLPQGFSVEVFEGVREKAQDRFEQMVQGIRIENLAPVKIIQVKNLSTTEQISELLSYAKDAGAELIVAGTRARKGAPRWFFGSFAESLTLRSDIPLLIVNPSWKPSRALFKKILFPTDFSAASHEAFQEVIRLAQTRGAQIQLFHKYYHIAAPVWNSPLEAKLSYRGIFEDGLKAVKESAAEWIKEATSQGVRARVKIDTGPGDSTSDAILRQAKDGGLLIAMASQSGGLEVGLIGSVTRKVIRSAVKPVWVLHASLESKEARNDKQFGGDSRLTQYEDEKGFKFPRVM